MTTTKTVELTTETLERFIGGQLEIQNQIARYVFRGEIKSISLEGDVVKVTFSWLAESKEGYPPLHWVKSNMLEYRANTSIYRANEIDDGRVAMSSPVTGEVVIFFPPDGSKLDPKKVEGLTIT